MYRKTLYFLVKERKKATSTRWLVDCKSLSCGFDFLHIRHSLAEAVLEVKALIHRPSLALASYGLRGRPTLI